ncbi:efflux RND transporter periplasmic adaptor subunit [Myxococcota bacterium]|nr:efflux RND transporter periplasmic adaptor subunit [Myxococcota bacterium]
MTLTPVTRAEISTGAVRVDAQRRSQFGIELEAAAVRQMGSSLQVPAVVTWDADALSDVTVRASGWVKHVRGAPGEAVGAGEVLFTLFSPELVTAQDDLLRATAGAQDGDPASVARRDAARLRLMRLGLAASEIDAIVTAGRTIEDLPIRAPRAGVVLDRTAVEGAMVSPGQTLYRLGDASTVWVEGAIPEDQVGRLAPGQAVEVDATGLEAPLAGRVERVLPQLDATTRTARVRVSVRNPSGALRPDQWATLRVDIDGGEHLAVPESAVLYTGPRRVVFVDAGDDLLSPRDVVTGMKSDGYVEILDGLAAGEQVVRAGNFLVAADSRLKKGGETGHKHGATPDATPDATPADHAGHDMSTMEGR